MHVPPDPSGREHVVKYVRGTGGGSASAGSAPASTDLQCHMDGWPVLLLHWLAMSIFRAGGGGE